MTDDLWRRIVEICFEHPEPLVRGALIFSLAQQHAQDVWKILVLARARAVARRLGHHLRNRTILVADSRDDSRAGRCQKLTFDISGIERHALKQLCHRRWRNRKLSMSHLHHATADV